MKKFFYISYIVCLIIGFVFKVFLPESFDIFIFSMFTGFLFFIMKDLFDLEMSLFEMKLKIDNLYERRIKEEVFLLEMDMKIDDIHKKKMKEEVEEYFKRKIDENTP